MEKILTAGRFIFPLSFLLYIGLHLGKPETGAAFVPRYIPFPLFWNYLTAVFILMFITAAVIKKYDGLAYSLMALYVLLMAILVHLPGAIGHDRGFYAMAANIEREKELEMVNIFRNIMVTGALMAFAKYVAKDKRFISRTNPT
jgi:ABC-type xylose transport system permease subunit